MKKVFKYPVGPRVGLPSIPKYSKFVMFGIQDGQAYAWFEIQEDQPKVTRNLFVVGTGHPILNDVTHLASIQDGPYVWHLYEGEI